MDAKYGVQTRSFDLPEEDLHRFYRAQSLIFGLNQVYKQKLDIPQEYINKITQSLADELISTFQSKLYGAEMSQMTEDFRATYKPMEVKSK